MTINKMHCEYKNSNDIPDLERLYSLADSKLQILDQHTHDLEDLMNMIKGKISSLQAKQFYM